MRVLTAIALLFIITTSRAELNLTLLNALFSQFNQENNITYSSQANELYRFQVFQNNSLLINELQQNDPNATYGITKFANLTQEEFAAIFLTLQPNDNPSELPDQTIQDADLLNTPTSWDWRNMVGVVTSVKDQGRCGSCWAFSAAANIEGQYFLKHKVSYSFSEQQLLDCVTADFGCNGGWMNDAFSYLEATGGQELVIN